jgi:hypothetical protein
MTLSISLLLLFSVYHTYFLILIYLIVAVIVFVIVVIVFIVCSVSFIVCVVLCAVFSWVYRVCRGCYELAVYPQYS